MRTMFKVVSVFLLAGILLFPSQSAQACHGRKACSICAAKKACSSGTYGYGSNYYYAYPYCYGYTYYYPCVQPSTSTKVVKEKPAKTVESAVAEDQPARAGDSDKITAMTAKLDTLLAKMDTMSARMDNFERDLKKKADKP